MSKPADYQYLIGWMAKSEADYLQEMLEREFPQCRTLIEAHEPKDPDCRWFSLYLWGRKGTKEVLIPKAWAKGWIMRGRALEKKNKQVIDEQFLKDVELAKHQLGQGEFTEYEDMQEFVDSLSEKP